MNGSVGLVGDKEVGEGCRQRGGGLALHPCLPYFLHSLHPEPGVGEGFTHAYPTSCTFYTLNPEWAGASPMHAYCTLYTLNPSRPDPGSTPAWPGACPPRPTLPWIRIRGTAPNPAAPPDLPPPPAPPVAPPGLQLVGVWHHCTLPVPGPLPPAFLRRAAAGVHHAAVGAGWQAAAALGTRPVPGTSPTRPPLRLRGLGTRTRRCPPTPARADMWI